MKNLLETFCDVPPALFAQFFPGSSWDNGLRERRRARADRAALRWRIGGNKLMD